MSRDAIAALVHRYADAVVHVDAPRWTATWAADSVWDLGEDRRVEGRDAIVELWTAAMARVEAVVQTVLNGEVELDEDAGTGRGRWYLQEHIRRTDGTSSVMVGHYDDTYVRVHGEWHFASRELTAHYRGPPDLSGTFRAAMPPDA